MSPETQSNAKRRLARIEGQVRGLSSMIEADRYCIDVVTQIQAARAALARVESLILEDHMSHCVRGAMESGDLDERNAKVAELMRVLPKSRGA